MKSAATMIMDETNDTSLKETGTSTDAAAAAAADDVVDGAQNAGLGDDNNDAKHDDDKKSNNVHGGASDAPEEETPPAPAQQLQTEVVRNLENNNDASTVDEEVNDARPSEEMIIFSDESSGSEVPKPSSPDDDDVASPSSDSSNSNNDACPKGNPVSEPDESSNSISRLMHPESDELPINSSVGNHTNETNNGGIEHHHSEVSQHEGDNDDDGDADDDDDDGDFVAIELVSPKHSNSGEQHDTPQQSTMDTTCCVVPNNNLDVTTTDDHNDVKIKSSIPLDTTTNMDMGSYDTTTATANNNPITLPQRRKILRHPILTPLTKLPWDKIISAAGACDVLFNCKYSMRQVEDEVREEDRRIAHGGGGGGDEETEEDVHNRVGREDGYQNLSLGHEECAGNFRYEHGEEGCDADEFAELGLDCCSMLDEELEEEEVMGGGVANVALDQQQQPMSIVREEEEGHLEQQELHEDDERVVGEGNAQCLHQDRVGLHQEQGQTLQSLPQTAHDPSHSLSDEQKAEDSWKRSNPSLDMMLYRTMINE